MAPRLAATMSQRSGGDLTMADHTQDSSSFVKAFIPGLVIGLIVGMAVGVFIPPLMERSPTVEPKPGAVRTPASQRDPRPEDQQPPVQAPTQTPTPAPAPAGTQPGTTPSQDQPKDPATPAPGTQSPTQPGTTPAKP